jgi:hypothetical protein
MRITGGAMSASTIVLLFSITVIAVLLAGIIYAIVNKDEKRLQRSGSFASLAAFHDMQGRDKQNAIETIIEKKAEIKWEEEESGEGDSKNLENTK